MTMMTMMTTILESIQRGDCTEVPTPAETFDAVDMSCTFSESYSPTDCLISELDRYTFYERASARSTFQCFDSTESSTSAQRDPHTADACGSMKDESNEANMG